MDELVSFREAVDRAMRGLTVCDLRTVEKAFRGVAEALLREGKATAGPDWALGGHYLEFRVRQLFTQMGFSVNVDDGIDHDGVISPPDDFKPKMPCILEVKSGKAKAPVRDDLRQLDDWVFELSGEEKARKGLLRTASLPGLLFVNARLPSPHKGILVFNGPVDTQFDKRQEDWLGPNEKEFAQKRDFCVVRYDVLIAWSEAVSKDAGRRQELWQRIHACAGPLEGPDRRS